ncbi:MAG: hypothetical protein LRZ84_08635 [Desertifilum sp.]|nr:hypothetical protein [Desertifilum sp.]
MIEDNGPYPQEPQDDRVLELLHLFYELLHLFYELLRRMDALESRMKRRMDGLESRLDVVECSPSPWSSEGQSWADYRDSSDD